MLPNALENFGRFLPRPKSVLFSRVNWGYLISMPVIYGMIVPIAFFHICLEIYQQFCFRIYGIPLVKSEDYFIHDRQLWPYLNWLQKMNCYYCGYFNNLVRYAYEIGARTERFWCPIRYKKRIERTHSQYGKFMDDKDAVKMEKRWNELKDFSDIK